MVSNFPTSGIDPQVPLTTATVDENPIVEISATNGAGLNAWSPNGMLDPAWVLDLSSANTALKLDHEWATSIMLAFKPLKQWTPTL